MGAIAVETAPPRHQRYRETARIGLRLSRRIFSALWQQPVLVTAALIVVLAFSAIGVAYASHQSRVLFNKLSVLQAERDSYQREWSQLLLEESALSALSRIEQHAVNAFDMKVPERDDIVVVSAGRQYRQTVSAATQ